ncbi:MAG TPA: hypothetical protein VHO25_04615, partial [Polyangiaceae bacterium]|nr:hypothetical protein [Polyangiaceae bacterium]
AGGNIPGRDSPPRRDPKPMKQLILSLVTLTAVILVLAAVHGCEQQRCPECEACPTLSPEPVRTATETAPTETAMAEPTPPAPIDDLLQLDHEAAVDQALGLWTSTNGDTFEIVKGEKNSKTTYNFDVRSSRPGVPVAIGCGFEPTGDSWCRVYRERNEVIDESTKHVTTLLLAPSGLLRVNIAGVYSGSFGR